MDTLFPCCAGLDVHKKSVVVCVRRANAQGPVTQQVRTFGTMTVNLLALSDWLAEQGVTHVAMESTGVYWKPIFHILEGRFQVILANAQHIKAVPGRKTDVKDCQWIAELLQHGLIKSSFIPPEPIRELRDLTRQRTQLLGEKARAANRIQKVLEDANIKLAGVATDILGASCRDMLRQIIAGQTDVDRLADLARRRLRNKIPQLLEALAGRVTEHHRFQLKLLLEHVEHLEGLIARLDGRIEELTRPFAEQMAHLDTIPGIDRRGAQIILAELGADMKTFPTADHLASWAGMCPGNNENAGKRRRGRSLKGNRWLRQLLVQAARSASRKKGSWLATRYRRLKGRLGDRRAVVAVGHTLLGIIYGVLKNGVVYQERGTAYLDQEETERQTRRLVKRLEQLGHRVTLQPKEAPAA